MDPELAHYQYIHPKAISGQTSTDFGLPNILGDLDEGSSESDTRSRLWEAKYRFRKEMLPSFLGEAFGRKVSELFYRPSLAPIIENSVDFLHRKKLELYKIQLWRLRLGYHASKINHDERRCAPVYQMLISTAHWVARISDLKYSDILGLEKSIDAAYEIASQRLFDVFFDKFKLLDHLLALKHYFLLGYGDFADILMDALA
jgi:gamma-tubulin complex component 3